MYGINVCEYYLHNLEVLRESLSHIEPYPNEQSKNKWQTWPQMTPNDPTQTCCVMVRAHVCINSTSDVQTTFIHFIHFYLFWPTLISPIYQINGKWSFRRIWLTIYNIYWLSNKNVKRGCKQGHSPTVWGIQTPIFSILDADGKCKKCHQQVDEADMYHTK